MRDAVGGMRLPVVRRSRAAGVLGLIACLGACAELGFTDRVLWRLPSPDGTLLAVCQEIPEFDGPSYEVRLERPDGTRVKKVYRNGDGDPCSEVAWAPDGRTLAVLSGHVARVRFIDVVWALEQNTAIHGGAYPQIDLGNELRHRNASDVRFTAPHEIELRVCSPGPHTPGDNGRRKCGAGAEIRRIAVPDRHASYR
jgi:hypothetical protein